MSRETDLALRRSVLLRRRANLPVEKQELLDRRLLGEIEASGATISPASSLICLQSGDARERPLFLCHPATGEVLCYADLARMLGVEQPVYGLRAQGLDDDQPPLTEVEAMAAHYVTLLQTVQAEGPYMLGGWSMGGVVAFEIAQQILAQNQEVALLALIDSSVLLDSQLSEPSDISILGGLARSMGLPLNQIEFDLNYFEQLAPDDRLAYMMEQAKQANAALPDMEPIQVGRLFRVFKSNSQALRHYRAHTYSGHITLFKAKEQSDGAKEDLGGGKWAGGGVTVHEVLGAHYTMMQSPNVETLAEQLGIYL
jgi:thioesterase domain-containing protein